MNYAQEIRRHRAHSQNMKLPGAIIITCIFQYQSADELLESTTASTPVLANSLSVFSESKRSLLQRSGYTYYAKHTDIVHTYCKIVKTVRCVGWL